MHDPAFPTSRDPASSRQGSHSMEAPDPEEIARKRRPDLPADIQGDGGSVGTGLPQGHRPERDLPEGSADEIDPGAGGESEPPRAGEALRNESGRAAR
jgi:hypothetical protein